mmetsp:Transcript_518/g.921  ORF Transcript_518/g.921 Transcript_518/m.921 type:complete len:186 (+) Transcript_518:139-696(+)
MEAFISGFGCTTRFLLPNTNNSRRICPSKCSPSRPRAGLVQMNQKREWDDSELSASLKAKITELYGSEKAAAKQIKSSVEMSTERKPPSPSTLFEDRLHTVQSAQIFSDAARNLVYFVISMSILSSIVFTAMWYQGYVHDGSLEKVRFEAPRYGTDTYIDPYELLNKDLESSQGGKTEIFPQDAM